LDVDECSDLYASLHWTVYEDPNKFTNATKHDLRLHYETWRNLEATNAVEQTNPNVTVDVLLNSWPRYTAFIAVDEESL
jgi:hypothetical protein